MAIDDRETVRLLDAAREVFRAACAEHHGRVVDMAGDSVLLTFDSATAALRCALTVQQRLAPSSDLQSGRLRLPFRIGVHLGDVIEKDDGSVYGNGVNIAARLQALARPDEVFVSQALRDLLGSGAPARFEDAGEHALKNVAQPVRAWRAVASESPPPRHGATGLAEAGTVRFAERFELKPLERQLLVDGEPVALGARAFDLLLALAARAGELVHKSELLDSVWAGLVVEEANLTVQVSNLRRALGNGIIATIPGRGYRFTAPLEMAPTEPPPAPQRPATSPPSAVAGLIGRDDHLAALADSLSQARFVTVVGPAGVGKTALARAVAAQSSAGAVWVDMAPLTDAAQLLQALARALGKSLPDTGAVQQLAAAVGGRLLVLDNVEHMVMAAAAFVDELLQANAQLRGLATSQVRLAVAGERVHRLEPLELPLDSDTLDVQRGAMALFVQRARAADHRFEPTPAQLPLLRSICRRLDGLPLALEMAAARVPALGLRGLAQALDGRFSTLTTGRRDAAARHRTLQAALDWSHGLLSADEQRLYRWCGVFSGGFSLDLLIDAAAAASTPSDPPQPPAADEGRWVLMDTLAQLVDRSLVTVDDADPPRYRLLETMREHARRQLLASGEEPRAQAARLAALARMAQQVLDPDKVRLEHRLALLAEHDNVREALAWGQAQMTAAVQADTVLLACGTAYVAIFSSWRLQAMQWLEACEPLARGADMPAKVHARWWFERTRQWLVSGHDRARAMAEHTLSLYTGLQDDEGIFNALSNLVRLPGNAGPDLPARCEAMRAILARHPEWGPARSYTLAGVEANVCDRLGDKPGLLRHRLRELALARQMNNPGAATAAETNVVFALQGLDRHAEALERARALHERLGASEDGNAAYAILGLITSLRSLGQATELRRVLPRAWHLLRLHGLPYAEPHVVMLLSDEGRLRDAMLALGRAHARYAAAGMLASVEQAPEMQAVHERARAQLGALEADRLLTEGAVMDDADVDTLVLKA